MNQLFKQPKIIFLFLTVVSGIFILSPNLNYHFYLSPGDHGRDLYAYKKTFEGAVPYIDYSFWHGPLMPYYYSIFYKLFGVSIQSTLYGYNFLALLIGILIYLACATALSPGISFISALWYWAFRYNEFFYTFNHIGAIFFMVITIYCLLRYIKIPHPSYIYGAHIAILGAFLVRPHMGLAFLAAFYISLIIVLVVKQKMDLPTFFRRFIIPSIIAILAGVTIYGILLFHSNKTALSTELAFWKKIHFENIFSNIIELKNIMLEIFNASWVGRGVGLLLILMAASSYYYITKIAKNADERKNFWLMTSTLLAFIIFSLMEYLFGFRWFRWIWILVPSILLIFFLIGYGLKPLRLSMRRIIYAFLFLIAAIAVLGSHLSIQADKVPANRLKIGNNDIYIAQFQQENIITIKEVVEFLSNNLTPGEKIVVIDYEPLYYFLSGHDCAFRDTMFFNNPKNLELLTTNNVDYILLSNRVVHNKEIPGSVFGKDNAVELAKHLQNNFEVVATFGPWGKPADWISNHAIAILKRMPKTR